jgi:hypothetical protein
MGELVNLRQMKKRRAAAESAAQADANRRKFGRTKAEKQSDRLARDKAQAQLDQAKLDPDGSIC